MIVLYMLIIPVIYILIKLTLYLIVKKYGKFSYDGFSAAGFAYNSEKDIFYSTRNAWQKNFGYTHAYDVLAPIFRMIIDTETIKFYYDNRNWLITFWKGQYGIVTGAEIGIYCTSQKKVDKNTIYFHVNDDEMLDMNLVLYKNGKIVTKARVKHWWLAVFKLGMFSKPKELSMDISIDFPNQQMLEAFSNSFKKLGYTSKDFTISNNTFNFKYTKPRTRKVWTRTWLTDSIRQFLNRKNVKLYNKYLEEFIDDNKIDDSKTINSDNLIMVNDLLPDILKNTSNDTIDTQNTLIQVENVNFSKNPKNVVLFNNKIYSDTRDNKL